LCMLGVLMRIEATHSLTAELKKKLALPSKAARRVDCDYHSPSGVLLQPRRAPEHRMAGSGGRSKVVEHSSIAELDLSHVSAMAAAGRSASHLAFYCQPPRDWRARRRELVTSCKHAVGHLSK
jgi:hypothetical protein